MIGWPFVFRAGMGRPDPGGDVEISARLRVILKMSVYIMPQFPHIVPEAADHYHQGLGLLVFMLGPVPVPPGDDRPGDHDDQDSDGSDDLADLC